MARVLIVEDAQTDRNILERIVKRTGHDVYFASDDEQALEIYVKQSIEIVITDLHTPQRDGQFISMLRALFPDTPVIAASGQGPDLLVDRAKRMRAFVALSKPIDPRELVEALAKVGPDGSTVPNDKRNGACGQVPHNQRSRQNRRLSNPLGE